jgi:hypothetical protein
VARARTHDRFGYTRDSTGGLQPVAREGALHLGHRAHSHRCAGRPAGRRCRSSCHAAGDDPSTGSGKSTTDRLRYGDVGSGRTVTTHVAGFIDEPLGVTVDMSLDALGRLLDEPETMSGVFLHVDPTHERELHQVLERTPAAATLGTRRGAVAAFHIMSDASLRFIRRIEILFSAIIAFGVVYKGVRIAQAERAYELATLRVLGFTRGEISGIGVATPAHAGSPPGHRDPGNAWNRVNADPRTRAPIGVMAYVQLQSSAM